MNFLGRNDDTTSAYAVVLPGSPIPKKRMGQNAARMLLSSALLGFKVDDGSLHAKGLRSACPVPSLFLIVYVIGFGHRFRYGFCNTPEAATLRPGCVQGA